MIDNTQYEHLIPKKCNKKLFEEIFDSHHSNGESERLFKSAFGNNQGLLDILKTSKDRGLDPRDYIDTAARIEEYGSNDIKHTEETEVFDFLFFLRKNLRNHTVRMLLISCALGFLLGTLEKDIILGMLDEAVMLFTVLFIIIMLTYKDYHNHEEQLSISQEVTKKKVQAIRTGKLVPVDEEDILVGDILHLKAGEMVNVDGFLVAGKVFMNECHITGDSDCAKKTPQFNQAENQNEYSSTPIILSGTEVHEGNGLMVVCAVGKSSYRSRMKNMIKHSDEVNNIAKTPLQKEMDYHSQKMENLGYLTVVILGIVIFIKELIQETIQGMQLYRGPVFHIVLDTAIICITVIIVTIPEGIQMAFATSQDQSADKLTDNNCLVKRLDRCDILGNVNNICINKTGILSIEEFELTNVFIWGKDYKASESKDIPMNARIAIQKVIRNNVTVIEIEKHCGKREVKGDAIECALVNYLNTEGYDRNDNAAQTKPEFFLPFRAEYKYMITIYKDGDQGYKLYIKGALERILMFLKDYETEDGPHLLSKEFLRILENQQRDYGLNCLSTLSFAYKDLTLEEVNNALVKYPGKELDFFNELAQNSVFVLMIALEGKFFEGASDYIKFLKEAGITVRLVTGENYYTGIAVAKTIGILSCDEYHEALLSSNQNTLANPITLDGEAFKKFTYCGNNAHQEEYSKEYLKEIVKNLKVIYNSTSEEKLIIVNALNNFVAVTGNENEDVPALKAAQVGFTTEKRGTEKTKKAASIVVMGNPLSSIFSACKYGRNMHVCMCKFIHFKWTSNTVIVSMILIGGVICEDSPLTVIQLLWFKLIIDVFSTHAFSKDEPSDSLMKRKPFGIEERIITPLMMRHIIFQALFEVIVLTIILIFGDYLFNVPSDRGLEHSVWNGVNGYHLTIFYNILVFFQMFNLLSARNLHQKTNKSFLRNPQVVLIISIMLIVQMLIVNFGGKIFRTQPLSLQQHFICFGIASLSLIVGILVKNISLGSSAEKKKPRNEREEPLLEKKNI